MDHLYSGPYVRDDATVPYVAREVYRGISFFECASKTKAPEKLERVFSLTAEEAASLAQTWLFFSLLQEVLGSFFQHEDYITVKTDHLSGFKNVQVTTAKLISRLKEWAIDVRTNPHRYEGKHESLCACFRLVDSSCGHVNQSEQYRVFRSIRAFHGVLNFAIKDAFHSSPIRFAMANDRGPTEADIDYMRLNGSWCPFQASRAWTSCNYMATAMFLRWSKKPKQDAGHSTCTQHHCEAMKIRPETHQLKHVTNGCTCRTWYVNERSLFRIVQTRRLALLRTRFTETGDVKDIALVAARPKQTYIALSHVWSDGLGNPNDNALKTCQIHAVARSIRSWMSERHGTNPGHEAYFWLDTLCCPARTVSSKLTVLGMMRDIYLNAAHVLVLDSDIQRHAFKTSDLLASALVVFMSKWMWRLWTLQEAVLAQKLWFKFSDSTVDIKTLEAMVNTRLKVGHYNERLICLDFIRKMQELAVFRAGTWGSMQEDFSFEDLRSSVEFRSVSIPADEPLCLGTILGFDVANAETVPGKRMALFWTKYVERHDLDPSIIFIEFPRLQLAGFRWAPSTLLRDTTPMHHKTDLTVVQTVSQSAKLTDKGLIVHYPGVILQPKRRHTSCDQVFEQAALQGLISMRIYDPRALTWYHLHPQISEQSSEFVAQHQNRFRNQRKCALILEEPIPRTPDTAITTTTTMVHGSHIFTVAATLDGDDDDDHGGEDGEDDKRFSDDRAAVRNPELCVKTAMLGQLVPVTSRDATILSLMANGQPLNVTGPMIEEDRALNRGMFVDVGPGAAHNHDSDQTASRQWITDLDALIQAGYYFEMVEHLSLNQRWIVD